MRLHLLACAAALCAAATPSFAQSGGFATPGMPARGTSAFGNPDDPATSNSFNPAIGLVFDVVGDYIGYSGSSLDDGFDAVLRVGEMTAAAWVDPSAFAYAAIVYADDEVALEEGMVRYTGFDSNLTLSGGRFFVDFGKQMQAHVHDLRTLERPAVLRTYLGDELGGDGVQMDNWFVAGDDTVVRYSVAAFGSLISHEHGHDDDHAEAEPFDQERKGADELAFTARITGFTDVGDEGTLQVGASARVLPDFGLEAPDSTLAGGMVDGLSNNVFGLDVTYGITDETQTSGWTFGGEFLLFNGDVGGEIDDNVLIGDPSDDLVDVVDGTRTGFYVFADRAFDQQNSVGAQWSLLELPENGSPDMSEIEAYYSRNLSEFQRVRLAVSHTDMPHEPDYLRLAVQWTAFLGPHSHGVNW